MTVIDMEAGDVTRPCDSEPVFDEGLRLDRSIRLDLLPIYEPAPLPKYRANPLPWRSWAALCVAGVLVVALVVCIVKGL